MRITASSSEGVTSSHPLTNSRELETLPNIDINIKCGNSLISRFALDADMKQALKSSKQTIQGYRSAVDAYAMRKTKSRSGKWRNYRLHKSNFKSNIDFPLKKKLSTARAKVDNLSTQINVKKQWGEKVDKKMRTELEKGTKETEQAGKGTRRY